MCSVLLGLHELRRLRLFKVPSSLGVLASYFIEYAMQALDSHEPNQCRISAEATPHRYNYNSEFRCPYSNQVYTFYI